MMRSTFLAGTAPASLTGNPQAPDARRSHAGFRSADAQQRTEQAKRCVDACAHTCTDTWTEQEKGRMSAYNRRVRARWPLSFRVPSSRPQPLFPYSWMTFMSSRQFAVRAVLAALLAAHGVDVTNAQGAKQPSPAIAIIPQPVSVVPKAGEVRAHEPDGHFDQSGERGDRTTAGAISRAGDRLRAPHSDGRRRRAGWFDCTAARSGPEASRRRGIRARCQAGRVLIRAPELAGSLLWRPNVAAASASERHLS